MAAEPSLGPGGPPLTYRLEDLRLSVTREPGNGTPAVQRLSVHGTGAATLERAAKKHAFRYPTKDLMARLNELYGMRFFELPTQHDTRFSVFVKEDGTVGTQALRLPDAASTSVCFTLPGFEKCVTCDNDDSPRELAELAKRLLADADRLVRSQPPGQ